MNWDNFKNRLQEDSSKKEEQVDIDAIWNAIEPEVDALNDERRKKRFLFFWVFGLGFIFLSGILFFYLKNENTSITESQVTSSVNSEKSNDSISSSEKNIFSEKSITTDSDNVVSKSNNSNISSNQNSNIESNFSNKRNNILSEKNDSKKSINTTKTNDSNNVITNRFSNKKYTTPDLPDIIFNDPNLATNAANLSQNQKGNLVADSDVLNQSLGKSSTTVTSSSENSILFLSSLNLFLENEKIEYFNFDSIENNLIEKSPKGSSKNLTFSLGIQSGLGYASRKLDLKNGTGTEFLNFRNEKETSLETSQLGLMLSLRFQPKKKQSKFDFDFTTGIQRTSIVERLDYNNTFTDVTTIDGVTKYRIDLNNDTIPLEMGVLEKTTTTEYQKKLYSRYHLYELPLLFGIQSRGDNWKFGVQLGVVPNLTLKTKGTLMNADFSDLNIEENQNQIFKSNIGMSYQLGFSIRKSLKDNIELSFTPSVRYFPTDFTVTNYPVSQKYLLMSGNIGVSYMFKK